MDRSFGLFAADQALHRTTQGMGVDTAVAIIGRGARGRYESITVCGLPRL
jgi:hypothetical protein